MFEQPTRNHITVIFERLGGMFFVIALIALSNLESSGDMQIFNPDFWRRMRETAQGTEDYCFVIGAGVFLAAVVVILLVALRFWSKTVFYIEDGYLIYERNTIYKKKSKLPIDIIATVNLERNVFERIVGTAKVKLDINSAHTADATDFTLVLALKTAQSFKETITAKKAAATMQEVNEQDEPKVVIAFTPAQVIRHKLLSLPIMQGIFAVLLLASQSFDALISGGVQLRNAMIFAFGLGAAAVVVSILNMLDYTVSADDKNFYITKGRLKKVSYTFSRSRINAVFVKQPLLARIFGYSSIEVAVIGLGNEQKETPCLCLLSDKAQTQQILSMCAGNFSVCDGEAIAQSRSALIPAALRVAVIAALSFGVLLIPEISLSGAVIVMIALIAAAAAAISYMAYRTKSVRLDGTVFHYTRGIFTKKTGMFRYDRLQTVSIKTNLLMKKMSAEKTQWSILSGAAMKIHESGWFGQGIFEQVAEKTVSAEDASTQLL